MIDVQLYKSDKLGRFIDGYPTSKFDHIRSGVHVAITEKLESTDFEDPVIPISSGNFVLDQIEATITNIAIHIHAILCVKEDRLKFREEEDKYVEQKCGEWKELIEELQISARQLRKGLK